MIVDKVRFITTERCDYGKFTFFFGVIEGNPSAKWYYVNSENEIFNLSSCKCKNTDAFRIKGVSEYRTKMFYLPKIEKLRVEFRSSMKVNKIRKIETN